MLELIAILLGTALLAALKPTPSQAARSELNRSERS